MYKPVTVEKTFKEKDRIERNLFDRKMAKDGYYVFNTRKFEKRNTGKTVGYGMISPILGLTLGTDKFVKVTYRLKNPNQR